LLDVAENLLPDLPFCHLEVVVHLQALVATMP
jgi:hypothetical protein